MPFDVEGLLTLWTDDIPAGPEAEQKFLGFYTDPVVLNGVPTRITDLVTRARTIQSVFEQTNREVLDMAETGDKVTVVFRMYGRQVGELPTSAGVLPPTGEVLDLRVIDLLTLADGRITSIWMVADELGALAKVDAVSLQSG
jgi:predicted ester cyclase